MIGLLGGMSCESSAAYYRILNEETRKTHGGLHSADLLLRSVDFAAVADLQHRGEWSKLDAWMAAEGRALEAAGARSIVICTNLMHRCARAVQSAVSVPLVHIAEAVARHAVGQGLHALGLLGTKGTMEAPFYRDALREHGILEVLTPGDTDREYLDAVIYSELCQGRFLNETKKNVCRIADELGAKGAAAVVLACTELPLLLEGEECSVPLLDTVRIHCNAALERDKDAQTGA